MPQKPTLPALEPESWSEELSQLRDGFAGQLNVYKTMAHNPALLRSWAALRHHVVLDNALGFERLEIAVLRVAVRLGSDYEWRHHVRRAAAIGVSNARVLSIRGPLESMSEDDAMIARSVDALIDHSKLGREDLDALLTSFGKKAVLDLMATVGFYKTLGCIANTFDLSLDDLDGANDPNRHT